MSAPRVGAPPPPLAASAQSLSHPCPQYQTLQFENLTAAEAPLLKIFYWECCDIANLNAKLKSGEPVIEHCMCLPNGHIDSHPVKLVFWVRNCSQWAGVWQVKRLQNCDCKLSVKRVTINQYRHAYDCPHRPLINIAEESMPLEPEQVAALTVICNFYLFGQHRLSYQIKGSDERIIRLHFDVDIGSCPQKSILTRDLLPVEAKEFRRFVQPIWVRNPSRQSQAFLFGSFESGLRGINPILSVPGQSVWPLLVKYRPLDKHTEFELVFQHRGTRSGVKIIGSTQECPQVEEVPVPLLDPPCPQQPYMVYPNKLEVTMPLHQLHTRLVAVHNCHTECTEFQWQLYELESMFQVCCEPKTFRLKPNHNILCMVLIRSNTNALHFTRIPLILEVHRVFDKATRWAKGLLHEVESIDDPKWEEPSYRQHLAVQLNLKVEFAESAMAKRIPMALRERHCAGRANITVFEQFFWQYLRNSKHLRDVQPAERLPDTWDANEVLETRCSLPPHPSVAALTSNTRASTRSVDLDSPEVNPVTIERVIGGLLLDVLKPLAQTRKFIPPLEDTYFMGMAD